MEVIDDCFVLFGGFGGILPLSFDKICQTQKKKDGHWENQKYLSFIKVF
jgi:hypothetical protein